MKRPSLPVVVRLSALLSPGLSGCSHLAVLQDPAPMAVAPRDPGAVRQAILMALPRRRWIPEAEGTGFVIARLDIRTHQARVRIDYDATMVRISYLDSTNLDFGVDVDGTPYIHRNYNAWVRNLASDISAAMATPMAVVVGY